MVRLGDRGGMFYCKDSRTGSRTSLETKSRQEAVRLIQHKNEAEVNPTINRKIGLSYLSASDPECTARTWAHVMRDIVRGKQGPTLDRYLTAFKDPAYKLIENRALVETLPDEFMKVLDAGTVCTNVYLRRLQNYAVDMDWLPKRVLPKKLFPKIQHKEQRAITWDEHCRMHCRHLLALRTHPTKSSKTLRPRLRFHIRD